MALHLYLWRKAILCNIVVNCSEMDSVRSLLAELLPVKVTAIVIRWRDVTEVLAFLRVYS